MMHEPHLSYRTPGRRPIRRLPRAPRGFTIIELMVVVTILAILTALAAPNFRPLIERWRVQQGIEGLQSSLYFARAEAIRRGSNVTLRKIAQNTDASNLGACKLASGANNWDCGWTVFVDVNGNGSLDSGDELLQQVDAPNNVTIVRDDATGGGSLVIDRWGRTTGAFTAFSFMPLNKANTDASARALCMGSGGRIRTIKPPNLPCTAG